jgi:23S rRNA pseudouridine1911/1915/1917 synthase
VGKRLDRYLAEAVPDTSRARVQEWIEAGRVLVNSSAPRPSLKLRGGESIEVDPAPPPPLNAQPEDLPLDILYEDGDLAVINKAAGMTVHAGGGVHSGTLVNALLHHFDSLSTVGGEARPGIVHRLDRLTSGVIVVAKNDRAHQALAAQFQSRRVRKTYWALVHGDPEKHAGRGRRVESDGHVWTRLEMPIRRDPRHRVKMSARSAGRASQTDFRVLRTNGAFSLLEVRIATGRTHQIRVHLSTIGHPVAGDRLYGASAKVPATGGLPRFFLHSREICFEHPISSEPMCVNAPLPPEFTGLLEHLAL